MATPALSKVQFTNTLLHNLGLCDATDCAEIASGSYDRTALTKDNEEHVRVAAWLD